MRFTILLCFVLLSVGVRGQECQGNCPQYGGDSSIEAHIGGQLEITGDIDNSSGAESSSDSLSESSSQASVGPVTVPVTINESAGASSVKIRNVPGVSAPAVYPSVSCFRGSSAGLAVPGGGFSFGRGKIDEDCVKREYIRLAYSMGDAHRAVFLWCQQPAVYEDFGSVEECLKFSVEEAPPDKPPVVDEQKLKQELESYPTEPEVDERVAPLQEALQEAENRVARLEGELRALRRERAEVRRQAQEREQWKRELAEKFLPEKNPSQD